MFIYVRICLHTCTRVPGSSKLTWNLSRAMAVMLIVDTNTLVPENIGTSLHMVGPNFHTAMET